MSQWFDLFEHNQSTKYQQRSRSNAMLNMPPAPKSDILISTLSASANFRRTPRELSVECLKRFPVLAGVVTGGFLVQLFVYFPFFSQFLVRIDRTMVCSDNNRFGFNVALDYID